MWIQELIIKNFGKFSDKRIVLQPGINLIYGENESGKTTLHTFIRGCLYGIKKMRGRASKTDVYSRYQPWERSAYFAGAMRFVCGRKVFRLERDFTKGVQAGMLVCETDGERLSLENGDLEMLLGNIGEAAFDNTVSIGQMRSETDEGLAIELKNYMANVEGTGSVSIHVGKAQILLKEQKKQLEKQLSEEQEKEEQKIGELLARIHFLEEELEKERRELARITENFRMNEIGIAEGQTEQSSHSENRGFWNRLMQWIKRLFAKLFGRKSDSEELKVYKTDAAEKSKLLGKLEQLENQIQEKEILVQNCKQEIQLQKEQRQGEKRKVLQSEITACTMAVERIQQVVSQMQIDVGQFLKKRTSEIFSEITEGRYKWVEIQENMSLGVHSADRYIPVEQLSRGTIWQLYFALRMAANEVLCQEENLPVILDDAFVLYDDKRLGQVLRWLARQKKQVLILTCQKREKEWLERSKTPFHEVVL